MSGEDGPRPPPRPGEEPAGERDAATPPTEPVGRLAPLALVTQLGLTVVASLLGTLLLGIWLDGLLGTRPLLTLVLALVGVLAGCFAVYRLVSQAIAQEVRLGHLASRPGRGGAASGPRRSRPSESEDDEARERQDESGDDKPGDL